MMNPNDFSQADSPPRWCLWLLLAAAAGALLSGAGYYSLASIDDCLYAAWSREMLSRGGFMDVTWNGNLASIYPPLQFWLNARVMGLAGVNDLAARLPVALMALALLGVAYRLGRLTAGPRAGLMAVALLLLTPFFHEYARRVMMEIPLALWVAVFFWFYLEGLRRPRLHLLLALPLAAAILTKSVLGLLPLAVLPVAMLASPRLRPTWSNPWLWAGLFLGLALGASWTVHQIIAHGPDGMIFHYGSILGRAGRRPLTLHRYLTRYLFDHSLWGSYQPVVTLALGGVGLWAWRRWQGRERGLGIIVLWLVLPLLLYSLSVESSDRYIFSLITPMALLGGYFLLRLAPRAAVPLSLGAAVFCLLLAAGYWAAPGVMTGQSAWLPRGVHRALRLPDGANRVFKQRGQEAARLLAGVEAVPYWGGDEFAYMEAANPFLWYWDRWLFRVRGQAEQAAAVARQGPTSSLVVQRERLGRLARAGIGHETLISGRDWVWVKIAPGGAPRRQQAETGVRLGATQARRR
jgi:4-amino-4-deoxy-L-arabinose transferase-like glycosyltransferase